MSDSSTDLPHPEPAKSIFSQPEPMRSNDAAKAKAAESGQPKDTATAKLRAFEDAQFGKKAVRIRGHIEKGYGSPFKEMPAEKHAEYSALEKLVEAEAKVDAANVALTQAKVQHDAALEALALASKASEQAAADAKKLAAEESAEQQAS